MSAYQLATDEVGITHILSDVEGVGMCRNYTGSTTHIVNCDKYMVVRLLFETSRGCKQCANTLIGIKKVRTQDDESLRL